MCLPRSITLLTLCLSLSSALVVGHVWGEELDVQGDGAPSVVATEPYEEPIGGDSVAPEELMAGEGGSTAQPSLAGGDEVLDELCRGPVPQGYPFEVGEPSFGKGQLIEYRPGDLPIILGVPHGGLLEPEELVEDHDELARDSGSLETALLVYEQLQQLTGRTPHMIINHVKRNRLNLNRVDARPNVDHPLAINAYHEFHAYVDEAKRWVSSACGRGHYFDFHTNGHIERWVEVGVGLSRAQLARSDVELDQPKMRRRSFYRSLTLDPKVSLAALVRGPLSLGGLLEREGIRVVPSPKHPSPGEGGYFSGGYNSKLHGSRDGGLIDSSQLEIHYSYIRAQGMARQRFSHLLSLAIARFMQHHYGYRLLDEEE